MLFPTLALQSVFFMFGLLMTFSDFSWVHSDLQLAVVLTPEIAYFLTHPLICIRRDKFLRQNWRWFFQKSQPSVSPVPPPAEPRAIFVAAAASVTLKTQSTSVKPKKSMPHNMSPESNQKILDQHWNRFHKLPPTRTEKSIVKGEPQLNRFHVLPPIGEKIHQKSQSWGSKI